MKATTLNLKCPNCQKEIPDPEKGYKVQLSTSDDSYNVCSKECNSEMNENIRNLIRRSKQDCFACSEPAHWVCPIEWLPIAFQFCSVACAQYIEKVLNEQKRNPIYNLLSWSKEKMKETQDG